MLTNRSVLAQLVAPHSVEEFLTQYWPDKWFAAHGDITRLPAFLRAPELASVEALSEKYRGVVCFTAGRKTQYLQPVDKMPGVALYRMGLTVKFDNIVPCVPSIAPELRQLESELGINTGSALASVFASPVSEGLPVHFDAQEVISIQLRGTKKFHVAAVEELPYPSGTQFAPGARASDDLYPQSRNGFPDPSRATFTTVEMKPGSVLFMPRGTWHYTEAGGDSMSVSIALHVPSAAELVLDQLRLMLLQKPQWRKPLYGAWGSSAVRESASARAAQLLTELPDIARQLRTETLMGSLLPPEKRLEQISQKTQFQKTPDTRVQAPSTEAKWGNAVELVTILVDDPNYGERVVVKDEVPARVAAAFRWIGERTTPFSAGELSSRFPQMPFAEHQRVLQAATAYGLVKMLWFQPLADEPAKQAG